MISRSRNCKLLTDKERKLLALALGEGAFPGEIDNSAVMLLRSWRARGVTPSAISEGNGAALAAPSEPAIYCRPDFGLCAMPWGKHKGELFKDISPGYLQWAFDWINSDMERSIKMSALASDIQSFLAQ